MNLLETTSIQCPYCGEQVELVIDCSIGQQTYIEDCTVCCKPIVLTVSSVDETLSVVARHENE